MDDLVTQCASITGCSPEVAERLLEACAGNLEMAINMHLEGSAPVGEGGAAGAGAAAGEDDPEEGVRAPIPQKTEMLVEQNIQYGFRHRRRKATSVFDGFRDFKAEAERQEEKQRALASAESWGAAGTSAATAATSKRRTLEDLFRPPLDLLHSGSFQSARDIGSSTNKWLLVNVQNVQEFPCQALNRDVWSNKTVKEIIQQSFIFWQVYHDGQEGEQFMKFYPVTTWPYVAVIDPRTGEHMVTWTKLDAVTFCDLASVFLGDNPSPDGEAHSPPKKREQRESLVEASEDSQLEAAIQASLTHQTSKPAQPAYDDTTDDESDDELETFSASDDDEDYNAPDTADNVHTLDSIPSSSKSSKSSKRKRNESDTGLRNIKSKRMSLCDSFCNETVSSDASFKKSDSERSVSNGVTNGSGKGESETSRDSETAEGDSKKTESESNGTEKEERWKEYLGNPEDELTKLVLRLPNGTRKHLDIPCSSQLMALTLYVFEQGFSSERYELVTTFPRRKLSDMEPEKTLKDIGVHPQETIFVQERS